MKNAFLLSISVLVFNIVVGQDITYQGNYHRINTPSGHIDIGPQNPNWAHIYTDRPGFMFNKTIYSLNGAFSAYNTNDLSLQINGSTKMRIDDATGNFFFNASDPNNAGFRLLFDRSDNNNGADVDLTINSNGGSPIVDWHIQNWRGSYVFSHGSANGKMKLFEIDNYGDIEVTGGRITGKNEEVISLGETDNLFDFRSNGQSKFAIDENTFHMRDGNLALNSSDPDNAGLNVKFGTDSNNNGGDVDLTIDTNDGAPIVDWYIRNWGGAFVFNRGQNDGNGGTIRKELFRISGNGDMELPNGDAEIGGMVHSREVRVDLEAGEGPDYVFEENYDLRSLEETKAYIHTNKHLPEVPSAKEMEANGIELGDMNMLLLKKIEELTLYILEQEERIKRLEEKNGKTLNRTH